MAPQLEDVTIGDLAEGDVILDRDYDALVTVQQYRKLALAYPGGHRCGGGDNGDWTVRHIQLTGGGTRFVIRFPHEPVRRVKRSAS